MTRISTPLEAVPRIHIRLAPAKPTIVFDTYWRFAAKRQSVFFARFRGASGLWTDDPILQQYKFTNAYRAADRVSQYLIRKVIYRGSKKPREIFFRTMLFKLFNRVSTWELLERESGAIKYSSNFVENYDKILSRAMSEGKRVYSAAYIMPSGGRLNTSGRKHRMHLELLERMIKDKLPEQLLTTRSMQTAFGLLRAYPTIGDFLAYQYVTDLNYSPLLNFDEMQFVVPGPGALSGIKKCFSDYGGLTEIELIRVMTDRQEEEFTRLGLKFETLWGRRLQLIDCQNLFCEVDKYSRVAHPGFGGSTRNRIKQKFQPVPERIAYWFPPKWGLNQHIQNQPDTAHDLLF